MILTFPTRKTEHNIYFVQFDFYKLTPMEIQTSNSSGQLETNRVANSLSELNLDSIFNYDTRTEPLEDTITLPVQTTITENTTGNYSESSMKNVSSALSGITAATTNNGMGIGDLLKDQARKRLPEELRNAARQAEAKAINEQMQIFYDGPNRRSYTFTFNLKARNLNDAREMKKIAKRLHYHASPSLGNSGTTWQYPSLTSFQFLKSVYRGSGSNNATESQLDQSQLEDIQSLFSSKKCFIESVNVEYGEDSYSQFTNGDESETGMLTIEMSLKEVDYFYRKDFAVEGDPELEGET